MPQELKMQEALKQAITAKKNLMDFYLAAAEHTQHAEGKKVFQRLAVEVRENANRFFSYYKGSDLGSFPEFMGTPPNPDSAMLLELQKAVKEDTHERRAREIALAEEQDMEQNFRLLATRIIDPAVRSVFDKVVEETRAHYQIIESEYARTMGMVHESDMDTYVRE